MPFPKMPPVCRSQMEMEQEGRGREGGERGKEREVWWQGVAGMMRLATACLAPDARASPKTNCKRNKINKLVFSERREGRKGRFEVHMLRLAGRKVRVFFPSFLFLSSSFLLRPSCPHSSPARKKFQLQKVCVQGSACRSRQGKKPCNG